METSKWEKDLTEEKLKKQIEKAKAAWVQAASNEPRAEAIKYSRVKKLITIKLTNGAQFIFPPNLLEGLGDASPDELADVHLSGSGDSVHWEQLDVDFSIPGLVSGILGTQAWMSELGRRGGKKTSPAKSAAARHNGAKGGRPRKKGLPV